jgi:methionine synthase I (cobalamin-dependent)
MSRFLEALRSGRVLLMDGGMGTELQKLGLQSGENTAAWNALHPERVRGVHEAYREAGAEVLLTNTFAILAASYDKQVAFDWREHERHRGTLREHATGSTRSCIALALLGTADVFRVVSAGPHPDIGLREFDARESYASCMWSSAIHRPSHLLPDAILFETWSTPRVRYPIRRVQRWPETTELPILLSLTYRRDSDGKLRTADGHTPQWFAKRAAKYGAHALGVNCGRDVGLDECVEIVHRYRQETDLPLFARPNAGTPVQDGDRWIYPHTPEYMAARLPELLAAGVSMVGGCCGTTPAHIAAFRPVVDAWNAGRR